MTHTTRCSGLVHEAVSSVCTTRRVVWTKRADLLTLLPWWWMGRIHRLARV